MIKRIKILLFIMMPFVLSGCGAKEYSEEEVSEVVKASLQEKYDTEFVVLSVSEKNAAINFADFYYVAHCTDTEGRGPFLVGIEKDGSHIRDNYEGYLYKQNIDGELLEILNKTDSVTFWNYGCTYSWSSDTSGSFRKYVKSGNVTLDAELSVNSSKMSEAAEVVFVLLDALRQKEYGASLKFYWKDMSLIFNQDGTGTKITRQYVDERFYAESNSEFSYE